MIDTKINFMVTLILRRYARKFFFRNGIRFVSAYDVVDFTFVNQNKSLSTVKIMNETIKVLVVKKRKQRKYCYNPVTIVRIKHQQFISQINFPFVIFHELAFL
jgi:hypothetical protein